MSKGRSSVSKAQSYQGIGDFWDTHDLADHWDETRAVEFRMDIQSEFIYYALDKKLSDRIQFLAKKRGVSADTLLNLWAQEKLQEQQG